MGFHLMLRTDTARAEPAAAGTPSRPGARRRRGTAKARAPAAAVHADAHRSVWPARTPQGVPPTTANAYCGGREGAPMAVPTPGWPGRPRTPAGRSHTRWRSPPATAGPFSPANRVKLNPLTAKASRSLTLEIGSSSDAELARFPQAYRCGFGRTPTRAVVASTAGVSSTTVASRLNTAVTIEASTKISRSRRHRRPKRHQFAAHLWPRDQPNATSGPASGPPLPAARAAGLPRSRAPRPTPADRRRRSPRQPEPVAGPLEHD